MLFSPFTRHPLAMIVTGSTALFAVHGHASADHTTMETVVVTTSGYEQVVTRAPASISVMDREQIENRSYQDLTDALQDLPGVIVTGGGSRQEISLRGMPLEYTVILVNGRKQSGRETQVSGGGGYEQDWLPPLNAIERIEVVRGPMSTLYGSDAIGGVINIITRKDYEQWHGSLRGEVTLQEDNESGNAYQGELYLAGPLVDGLLSASLTGLYQEREEDDILYANAGKTLDNYRASLYLTPTESDTFTLDYSYHDQERVNTEGKTRNASSQTNNHRQSVGFAHEGNYDWVDASSYISQEVVENEGRELEVKNTRLNSQWSLPIGDHYLVVGMAYEDQALDNGTFVFKNAQWSLFAENEWYVTESFALTAGLRFDDNEQFNAHLSPRLYGVWDIDGNWTFKGGVSTGYRAPSLTEIESDWVQEGCNGRCEVYGNPDLEPETSVNTEMALYFLGNDGLNANVTAFYNDFNDKIDRVALDESCTGRACDTTYVNVEDYVTYGAETAVSKDITDAINLSATYTFTRSEKKSGEDIGQPLTQIPEHLVSVNAGWAIRDDVNSWTRLSYRGKENGTITADSRNVLAPSVTYFDVGGHWQLNDNVKLLIGIYNLFDKETQYQEYGYVEDGRRYWLAIDTRF